MSVRASRDMKPEMQISERELRALTRDLDEMHHSYMPRYLEALAEWSDGIRDRLATMAQATRSNASRRNFLRGGLVTAGALGGGAIIAACGSESSSSSSASGSSGGGLSNTDMQVVKLAASLEVLAVSAYDAALQAAGKGQVGAVPDAIKVFATTAKSQHSDHQQAWNGVLTGVGQAAQTEPDPKYAPTITQGLQAAKTIVDVAKLALTLETIAAETYVAGEALVSSDAGRKTAATIAPVEAQHVAVLQFVLGDYPDAAATKVPSFIGTDMAASPNDLGGGSASGSSS